MDWSWCTVITKESYVMYMKNTMLESPMFQIGSQPHDGGSNPP